MNEHPKIDGRAQLNIKSLEARRLAIELAELTGESLTGAVTVALRNRLVLERRQRRKPGEVAAKLVDLGRRFSALPDNDTRSADEILGYDENGLPS